MLFAAQFQNIDVQIQQTEEAIRKLQEQLSELQAFRQELQSVEQAAESAITQIRTARSMINHVDPSQNSFFKQAVLAEFDSAIALPVAACKQ